MKFRRKVLLTATVALATCLSFAADASKRKIIIDQDAAGPAGTDQQSMLVLIQSPKTDVLGITVVTGDQWLKAEVAHTLRMLELIGRTDIPVVPGAAFPLVRRREEAKAWQERYGKAAFAGAWDDRWWHEPFVVPRLEEGQPTSKPAAEDAAGSHAVQFEWYYGWDNVRSRESGPLFGADSG